MKTGLRQSLTRIYVEALDRIHDLWTTMRVALSDFFSVFAIPLLRNFVSAVKAHQPPLLSSISVN